MIKTFPHLAGKALNLQANPCRQKRADSFTRSQKKSEHRKMGRPKQQEGFRVSEKAAVVIGALFNSDYVPSRSHDGMTTRAVVVTELVIELAGAIPGVKIKRPVDIEAL